MAKPLATNTDTVVHKSNSEIFRSLLHQMRFIAKDFKTLKEVQEHRKPRLAYCGHSLTVEDGTVNIVKQVNGNISFNGVASCSNYWRCPVCAYKIVQHKQKFLFGLAKQHDKNGGKMGFVTLTLRHKRRDRLSSTLEKINGNYRKFQQSRWFREFKKQMVGQVKSMEITWSDKNGWHPHLHLLYFYNKELSDQEITGFQKTLLKKWKDFKTKKFGNNNSTLAAQDQKICYSQNITEYTSKWDISMEMTKGNIKSSKGLTMMTALGKLAVQDYKDYTEKRLLMGLYGEYIEATFKKNFLTVSPSLRLEYADYFKEEKTDEEICTTAEIAEILVKISIPVWKDLSRLSLQPLILSVYQKPFRRMKEQIKNTLFPDFKILDENQAETVDMLLNDLGLYEKCREEGLENIVDLLRKFKKTKNVAIEIDKNNVPIIL